MNALLIALTPLRFDRRRSTGISAVVQAALQAVSTRWFFIAAVMMLLTQAESRGQTIRLISAPGKFYVDDKSGNGILYNYAAYTVSNNTAVTLPSVYVAITNINPTNRILLSSLDSGARALGSLAPGEAKMAAFNLKGPSFTGNSDTLTGLTNETHTIRVLNGPPGVGSVLVSSNYGFSDIIYVTEALANKVTLITNVNPYAVLGQQVVMIIVGDTGTIGGQNSLYFSPAIFSSWRPDCYELDGCIMRFAENPTYTNQLYFSPSVPSFTNFTGQSYSNVFFFRAVKPTGTNIAISPFAFIDSGSGTKHTAISTVETSGGSNIIYSATNVVTIANQTVTPNSLLAPGGTVTYAITFTNFSTIASNITLDEIIDVLPGTPANAAYIPGSATFNSLPLADPTIVGQALHWAIPFVIPANSVVVLTFQATAPAPAGQYTNTVTALLGPTQIDTTTDTSDDSPSRSVFTIIAVSDISVGKSGPANVFAGANFDYTITATNLGPSPVTGLSVTDSLPASLTFVTASSGGFLTGGQVIWTNLAVASNAVATLTVTVTAPSQGVSLTNIATGGDPNLDPNPTNNTSPPVVTLVTSIAEVAISKSGPAVPVSPNGNFLYNIAVTNHGPSIAGSLSVTDNLPSSVNFISATSGGVFSGGNVIWTNLGNLAAGGSLNLSISVTAPSIGGVTLTNIASVHSPTLDTNTVNNTTPPVITTVNPGPTNTCVLVSTTNVTTNNTPGQCGAIVSFPPPVTTGNCAPIVCTPPSGSFFPVGTTIVTCTNTDGINGPFQVTVLDTEPPVLNCPSNLVFSTDAGTCSRSNVTFTVTATDNCSTNVIIVCNPPSGSTFPVGTNTVVCTASDSSSNTNTCTFTIVIADAQAPTITCPTNVTVNANVGSCFATGVVLGSPTASDVCGSVTVTSNAPAQFPVGTNVVTWTVTDGSGNTNSCQQLVIVRDAQAPTITCPTNVTVNANVGSCFATGVVLGSPTASDVCGSVTVTSNAPAQFPVGTNVVTWTVTDGSGNTNSCQQLVIVRDAQAPTITCPTNVTVNANVGSCFATGVVLGSPTASDVCGAVTVSSNAPAQFPVGTNVVTWTATDASGNTNSCQQLVIVRDAQAPTITCPTNVTVNANVGSCFATGVVLGSPTASDVCGAVTVSSNAPAQFPVGTNVVTWTATDASGNTNSCQQLVIVRDAQAPTITCPTNVTVNANVGSCFATGVVLGSPTASDVCGSVTVTSNAPAQFPVGTNVVTWTVTDGSGNTNSCQQLVIVRDAQAPTITCPTNVTVNANVGSCFATGVVLGSPTASDVCGSVTVTSNAPAQFPVGTNVVTWTVTDGSGNTNSCQQLVIVRDAQAPTITCPTNVTVNANVGSCFATGVVLGSPTASDVCGSVTVSSNAPAQFPVGTNVVTWTATDASGNTNSCQQLVIVRDAQAPTITCPTNVTVNANVGSCFATGVVLGSPTASDVCGSVTVSSNAPAQFPVGTNVVTWTATDASGNTNSCQQLVIVRDAQAPTITCPTNVTVNANVGSCFATGVVLGSPTASDVCGSVTVSSNAPAQFPVGTNVVTWTATDASGNTNSCQQLVIVRDAQAPTITCPTNVTVSVAPGQSNVVVNFPTPTAIDLCGSVTNIVSVPSSGSLFPVGVTTVTNTATDNSGNSASCTFTVTVVVSNSAPVANPDYYTMMAGTVLSVPASIGVLSNDIDPNGDTLTALLVSGTSYGSLVLTNNGGFTYTPATNFIGTDTFTYQATDGFATSLVATVTIFVSNSPPQFTTNVGTVTLNRQTGLYEQNVTVTNNGGSTAFPLRLCVGGLTNNVRLFNAAGTDTNSGLPYVQFNAPLDPGSNVVLKLEFIDATRTFFNYTNLLYYVVKIGDIYSVPVVTNGSVNILGCFKDTRITNQPRFLIEFASTNGGHYTIIYQDGMSSPWQAATPSLTASNSVTQWYDDGPPKTVSQPFGPNCPVRIYRVIQNP